MIRVLQKADIERVVDIWLDTNLKAHYFIPGQYWKNNIDLVKEMLPQAEVYVYENDCQIEGFIGLNDEYMEGIFVRDEMQSQGIGKLLLNFVKEKKTKLYLNVYQKNTRAIHFYQREGFEIQREGLDEVTGEKDYVMVWQRGCVEHVMHFDNCRIAVFDRPWNSRAELPNDRFVRCTDWQEIDRLFEKLSEA